MNLCVGVAGKKKLPSLVRLVPINVQNAEDLKGQMSLCVKFVGIGNVVLVTD